MAKKTSKPTSAPSHPPTKPTTAEDIDDIFAHPSASTSTPASKPIPSGSALGVTGESGGKKKKNKGEKRKVEGEGGVGVDGPGGVDELNNEGISGGASKKKKMKKNIDGTLSSGLETQPKRSTKPLPKPTSKPNPNPNPETSPEIITISDPSILLKPSQSNLSLIPTTSESTNGKRKGKRMGGGAGGGGKVDDDDEAMFRDSRGDGPRRKTEEGFIIFKEAELDIDPEAGGTDLCPFDCDCCF